MSHLIPPSLDEADHCLPLEAPRWYVLRVIGGRERRTVRLLQDVLKRRGLIAYMPAETKIIRCRGEKSERRFPLVPGYIFVLATSDLFHVLRAVDGVTGFLSRPTPRGPLPMTAPVDFMTGLVLAEIFRVFDQTLTAKPSYKLGQAVKVAIGRYADWPGKVLAATDDGRVHVLLTGIGGRETRQSFDAGELKAA